MDLKDNEMQCQIAAVIERMETDRSFLIMLVRHLLNEIRSPRSAITSMMQEPHGRSSWSL